MSKKSRDLDVTIAGGGPGGLSALLWCRELGLNAVLLERGAEFGGQLLRTHNPIKNYLGADAENGREMRDLFLSSIGGAATDLINGAGIIETDLGNKTVLLADGRKYKSKAIILATGVRPRELGVPGESEFRGLGILTSGVRSKEDVRGKRVVIIGGGDAAVENALILSEYARQVIVVHRRDEMTARQEFLIPAGSSKKIEIVKSAVVKRIIGDKRVEAVELLHPSSKEHICMQADALLIKIGVQPNTDLVRGQLELDKQGYVLIDSECAASIPGVFAIGDVVNATAPTISGAVGHGATAAKAIKKYLNC